MQYKPFSNRKKTKGFNAFHGIEVTLAKDIPVVQQSDSELEKQLDHCKKFCEPVFDVRYVKKPASGLAWSMLIGIIAIVSFTVAWGFRLDKGQELLNLKSDARQIQVDSLNSKVGKLNVTMTDLSPKLTMLISMVSQNNQILRSKK